MKTRNELDALFNRAIDAHDTDAAKELANCIVEYAEKRKRIDNIAVELDKYFVTLKIHSYHFTKTYTVHDEPILKCELCCVKDRLKVEFYIHIDTLEIVVLRTNWIIMSDVRKIVSSFL